MKLSKNLFFYILGSFIILYSCINRVNDDFFSPPKAAIISADIYKLNYYKGERFSINTGIIWSGATSDRVSYPILENYCFSLDSIVDDYDVVISQSQKVDNNVTLVGLTSNIPTNISTGKIYLIADIILNNKSVRKIFVLNISETPIPVNIENISFPDTLEGSTSFNIDYNLTLIKYSEIYINFDCYLSSDTVLDATGDLSISSSALKIVSGSNKISEVKNVPFIANSNMYKYVLLLPRIRDNFSNTSTNFKVIVKPIFQKKSQPSLAIESFTIASNPPYYSDDFLTYNYKFLVDREYQSVSFKYYFSEDNILSSNDTSYTSERISGGYSGGISLVEKVKTPQSMVSKEYYVFSVGTITGTSSENYTLTTFDTTITKVTMQPYPKNFKLNSIVIPNQYVPNYGSITMNCKFQNTSLTSSNLYCLFYLSTDSILSDSDYLIDSPETGSLSSGITDKSFWLSCNIYGKSSYPPIGTYYTLVSYQTNNKPSTKQVYVGPKVFLNDGYPVYSNVNVKQDLLSQKDSISLSMDIYSEINPTQTMANLYYLSADTELSPEDYLVGNKAETINFGTSNNLSKFLLPQNIQSASYYIIVMYSVKNNAFSTQRKLVSNQQITIQ